MEASLEIWRNPGQIQDAAFQHSVLCQTYLPYRDPGDDVTLWEHEQGKASLTIQCLKEKHPEKEQYVYLGLPYGTKARLITAYLNTQAIITQSPLIDVDSSISSFIERIGLARKGKNVIEVKNQLARIAASIITLSYQESPGHMLNVRFSLVKSYDLWFPKDKPNKVSWPHQIELTRDYYAELLEHAVPLDERTLAALKNNAMALDIYAWLAQRLHRIPPGEGQEITWNQLRKQFGRNYSSLRKFKQVFKSTLEIVCRQYRDAKLADEYTGLRLFNSPSPIEKKLITYSKRS